jgi:hypothetical protein
MTVNVKVAATLLTLSLGEKAGVRETVMANRYFHRQGRRFAMTVRLKIRVSGIPAVDTVHGPSRTWPARLVNWWVVHPPRESYRSCRLSRAC